MGLCKPWCFACTLQPAGSHSRFLFPGGGHNIPNVHTYSLTKQAPHTQWPFKAEHSDTQHQTCHRCITPSCAACFHGCKPGRERLQKSPGATRRSSYMIIPPHPCFPDQNEKKTAVCWMGRKILLVFHKAASNTEVTFQ